MGGDDTDSEMMRHQQAMDVAERIPDDETRERLGPSDSDAASGTARTAAKAGQGADGGWAEDAVLRQNRAGLDAAASGEARAPRGGPAPAGSLASPGRSLLGD
ncbi:hypothetical protein D3218_03490 [Aureimonas flava]|uniref:Uncharacterized protein n=1 Tax=Aureimonas flava TaxID=2320271 RepID=A0A3A1WUX1_9HYPH|nr:hypothetical protein [Aureimonas flava]RIY02451.1 hypothetical protein D3218_03490 [Aureimonas flava]